MPELLGTYIIRLLVALAIGAAVGLEREFHGKAAGIRTNMLMCIGSCLIMIISIEVAREAGHEADPGRIAAQVVTGVGFLGAGTIIRSRFHVSGLTTAATIWVLSALGLAIGAGYILLAVAGAACITVTLTFIKYIENAIRRIQSNHIIQLNLDARRGIIGTIIAEFTALKIMSEALEVNRSGPAWMVTFEYTASQKKHYHLIEALSRVDGVKDVTEL
ncbi:MAG TPA: MgtC/SapB family protein [Patescibacteria group bacterium]|nr:MgtC/SapB family protein [Patescibacteria group bacterium]